MSFKKGSIPWNKGIPRSQETRHKISDANKNPSKETRLKMSVKAKARKHIEYKGKVDKTCEVCNKVYRAFPYLSDTTRFCGKVCRLDWMSMFYRGEKHWNWQGGKTTKRSYTRKYRNWRESVFKRDDYTCQICKARGVYIEAHHVKAWAHFPLLRYDIENGQTLCIPCHKLTDNYKGRANS